MVSFSYNRVLLFIVKHNESSTIMYCKALENVEKIKLVIDKLIVSKLSSLSIHIIVVSFHIYVY